MTRPGGRLTGAERRAAIVAAASALFAEQGFGGTTREIAARLGVTQALLYRYFESKDALIEAVFAAFRGSWDLCRAQVLAARDRPLADRLSDFYAAYVGRGTETQGVRLFLHAALAGLDLPLRYGPDLDALVLRPVLTALRAELGLPPPPDPLPRAERDLAIGLHGAVVFVGIRRHVYRAGITPERHLDLVDGIIRAHLPGMLDRLKLSCDNLLPEDPS